MQKRLKVIQQLKRMYPYLLILLVVILLLTPQVKAKICYTGLDSWFHMNQFYDTAMQIKTGHFSYFLSLFGFDGIGRIVNALYGPGFMYVMGVVLLIAKTWFNFEILTDFLGLTFGGILFYILARKNYVTRFTSTLLSLLYILSEPVMTWVINQEFNGIEGILIPLVLIQDTQMARKRVVHPVALSVTMTIIFQTHIMTTLVGTLSLIPFFIYAWYQTADRGRLWKQLGLSVGLTTLLTANVWGAMLNVLPQRLVPPDPQDLPLTSGRALLLMPDHSMSLLGPIYTIIMAVVIGYIVISLCFWKRSDALYKVIAICGLFFCWLSTVYFPWSWVVKIYPAFTYQIQFPKRFLCVGVSLTLLAVGMLFSRSDADVFELNDYTHRKLTIAFQVILLIFVSFAFIYQNSIFHNVAFKTYHSERVIGYGAFYKYHQTPRLARRIRASYNSTDLGPGIELVHQDLCDYMPTHRVIHTNLDYRKGAVYSGLQNQIYNLQGRYHFHRKITNNKLTLAWNQKRTNPKTIIPVVKYRDTQVKLNHHVIHPQTSRIGAIENQPVKRGPTSLSISYQEPMWLHGLMWLSVISWIGLVIDLIIKGIHFLYVKVGPYIPF